MPEIAETARVAKDAGALWREIGRFGAIGAWHPMHARVDPDGEQPGALRTAYGKDGSVQVERLLETDPDRRAYRYEMVSTGMPVENYVAKLRADDAGDGATDVVWHAEFGVTSDDEAGVVAGVRAFLRAGLDNLASHDGKVLG